MHSLSVFAQHADKALYHINPLVCQVVLLGRICGVVEQQIWARWLGCGGLSGLRRRALHRHIDTGHEATCF